MAQMEMVCVLIALATHAGRQVHHMDVKSALLNDDLVEEVYVQHMEGFVNSDDP